MMSGESPHSISVTINYSRAMKPDFPVVGHIHSFGIPTIYKVSIERVSDGLREIISPSVEFSGGWQTQRRETSV